MAATRNHSFTLAVSYLLPTPLVLLPAASAFELPLGERAVRDAYFLGQRNDEKTAETLQKYAQHLPIPERGPYISQVELLTPYALAVDTSRRKSVGYSAQQAAADYREHGETVLLRVTIEFTITYPATEVVPNPGKNVSGSAVRLRPYDFWRDDFRFGLSQNDKWIEPRSQDGQPIFGEPSTDSSSKFRGAAVWIEFDANQVASELAQAEVFTPDGQHVTASFDLAKLR